MKLFLPSNNFVQRSPLDIVLLRADNSSHESKEGGVVVGGEERRETEAEEKFGTCSRGGVLLVSFTV